MAAAALEASAEAAVAMEAACSSAQRRDSIGMGCVVSVTPVAYLRRHGMQVQVICREDSEMHIQVDSNSERQAFKTFSTVFSYIFYGVSSTIAV